MTNFIDIEEHFRQMVLQSEEVSSAQKGLLYSKAYQAFLETNPILMVKLRDKVISEGFPARTWVDWAISREDIHLLRDWSLSPIDWVSQPSPGSFERQSLIEKIIQTDQANFLEFAVNHGFSPEKFLNEEKSSNGLTFALSRKSPKCTQFLVKETNILSFTQVSSSAAMVVERLFGEYEINRFDNHTIQIILDSVNLKNDTVVSQHRRLDTDGIWVTPPPQIIPFLKSWLSEVISDPHRDDIILSRKWIDFPIDEIEAILGNQPMTDFALESIENKSNPYSFGVLKILMSFDELRSEKSKISTTTNLPLNLLKRQLAQRDDLHNLKEEIDWILSHPRSFEKKLSWEGWKQVIHLFATPGRNFDLDALAVLAQKKWSTALEDDARIVWENLQPSFDKIIEEIKGGRPVEDLKLVLATLPETPFVNSIKPLRL